MLTSPFFYGAFVWKGRLYVGDHEPIVTKAEWDRAQNPKPTREKRRAFAFRGLFRCSRCGHAFTAEGHKGHVYYRCARSRLCRARWIREDRLAALTIPVVEAVTIDDELAAIIVQALREAQRDKRADIDARRERVATARAEAEAKLEALWEDRLRGGVSEAMYGRLKAKFEAELNRITEEEAAIRTANLDYLARGERLIELCKGLLEAYVGKEAAEQRELLKLLCSNLFTDGVTVAATYERPFDVLAERPSRSSWLLG